MRKTASATSSSCSATRSPASVRTVVDATRPRFEMFDRGRIDHFGVTARASKRCSRSETGCWQRTAETRRADPRLRSAVQPSLRRPRRSGPGGQRVQGQLDRARGPEARGVDHRRGCLTRRKMLSEVRERRGHATAWSAADIPSGTSSAVISTRVPPPTALRCHVMVIVPANEGSFDSKSTCCTTPTPGSRLTKRASTTSESAVALPWRRLASILVRQNESVRAAGSRDRSARSAPSFPVAEATQRVLPGPRARRRRAPAKQRSRVRPCPCVASAQPTKFWRHSLRSIKTGRCVSFEIGFDRAQSVEPLHVRSSPPTRSVPNPARRNEATKLAILDAALDLIGAHGLEAVSVEAIAQAGRRRQADHLPLVAIEGSGVAGPFLAHRVEERTRDRRVGTARPRRLRRATFIECCENRFGPLRLLRGRRRTAP